MLITYRRTGGGFALILLATAGLVAMGITVALAIVLGLVTAAIATVLLLVRAVLPSSRRRQTAPPVTPWPLETIEGTVVNPHDSSDEKDLARVDSRKRVTG